MSEHVQRHIDADEEAAFLDSIDRWIEREVRPVVMHHDHNDIWPAELVEQMKEMGLFGATIGQEYGGLGLPATTYSKIITRISSYWMAITGIVNSHLIMAAAVERFGTSEQGEVAAQIRDWRDPRRSCPYRTRCRNRSSGYPHNGGARWR